MEKFSFLPGCRVLQIERGSRGSLVILVDSRRGSARCPHCGAVSRVVHSRYRRSPADLPAFGHELRVALLVRRFYCRQATCPKRTFAERFAGAVAPYARRTRRLAKALGRVGIALGGAAGARLARGLGMPVSRDTLLRVIRALPLPAVEPPRVVGVDDWALRKGRTYGTILVDLERRRVLDLLADRSANTVAGWLRDHPGIAVVARDRSTEYSRAATNGAGQATQVADRWHLLANTRQMLERWLFAVHGRLRRLPPVHTDASTIAPRRTRAFSRPRAERVASVASHERWLAVYKEVRCRHAAGETLLGIARSMGLARGTVRKYVQARSFPERALRAPGPSALDPFIPHLAARVAAGCENGMELWREVRTLGYAGRAKAVHLWLQQHRSVPAKTTPHRWRKETPTPSGGLPALLSPKRLAWALVKPAEARNDEEAAAVAQAEQDAETQTVAGLARRFTALVRAAGRTAESDHAAAGLEAWLTKAGSCGVTAVQTFAAGLEQDGAAVRAALTLPWSSGQAEGQINRLKLLKRQMYGRASLDLLRRRTLLAA